MRLQHLAAVGVKCPRIIECLTGRQRTKTRIQMIEARVDELQGQHLPLEYLAKVLMAFDVAPEAVTGEQRLAAEKSVAGTFEKHALGKGLHHEVMGGEPAVEIGRLPGPDLMAKARAEKAPIEDEPRVGRKDQIRQPGPRCHELHLNSKSYQRI